MNQIKSTGKNNYSPIVLFVYNRLDTLENLIYSLKLNQESRESDLFIFSDGPKFKDFGDALEVKKVRNYIYTIDGFKSIKIIESGVNKGLATSIIEGLNFISNRFESFIVLEDDLLVSPYFLKYLNTSLNKYKQQNKVCRLMVLVQIQTCLNFQQT